MHQPAYQFWDYQAYAALPQDGKRYEIIEGVLHVSPSPSSDHQTVSRYIQFTLFEKYELTGQAQVFDAPLDVIFSDKSVTQPDIALVLKNSRACIVPRGIEGPPDLIVEVLSASNRKYDLITKRNLYAQFEVPEYWIADPRKQSIVVHSLKASHYHSHIYNLADTLRSPLLTDLQLPLQQAFRRPW